MRPPPPVVAPFTPHTATHATSPAVTHSEDTGANTGAMYVSTHPHTGAQAAMDSAKLGIALHVRMGTKHTSAVLMATQRDIDTYHKCLGYLIRTRFNGEAAIHQVRRSAAARSAPVH